MIPSYIIQYSYRKTVGIRINLKGELIVSAPIGFSEKRVHDFVTSKKDRIINKIEYIKKQVPYKDIVITKEMKDHALIQILPRVEYYADIMKVSYNDLKITIANTKRGSCSSRKVLMFHRKLSKFPISIVDYVVVHELAHLVHFNHSKDFRLLVENHHPEYKFSKKRLKEHGNGLGLG